MRNAQLLFAAAVALAAISNHAVAAPQKDKPHGAGSASAQATGVRAANGAAAADPLFAIVDTDGDGVISAKELHKAVAAIKEADTDKDGNITWAEIVARSGAISAAGLGQSEITSGMGAGVGGGMGGEQSPAFKQVMQYDKNGDGKLTADELPPQMVSMLRNADLNGDHAIDARELAIYVKKMGDRVGAELNRGAGSQQIPGMNGHFPGGNPNGPASGAKSP
jgi:Ca2+-binding EF-hand superfamily protein